MLTLKQIYKTGPRLSQTSLCRHKLLYHYINNALAVQPNGQVQLHVADLLAKGASDKVVRSIVMGQLLNQQSGDGEDASVVTFPGK